MPLGDRLWVRGVFLTPLNDSIKSVPHSWRVFGGKKKDRSFKDVDFMYEITFHKDNFIFQSLLISCFPDLLTIVSRE